MNTMQGAFFFACSNMSRTRAAPTPTNISTNSEPEIEKNGTFASPAIALANSVLPHQQHAFRHAATEPAVVCRTFQEVHDFSQFVLGLVDAGDVFECDTSVGF